MALAALVQSILGKSFGMPEGALSEVPGDNGTRGRPMRLLFHAFVVDHGLRSGSDEEAKAVKARVEALGRLTMN